MRIRLRAIGTLSALFCVLFSAGGCYTREAVQDAALLNAVHPETGNIESASYVIRKGDHLRISTPEYMEFDTSAVVSEAGVVSMKLIGAVQVQGLTRAQAEKSIAERIGIYAKSPTIAVAITILKGSEAKVIMLGAVARPDTFAVTTTISLLESLAIAGGTQPEADLRRIKIFRHDPSVPPVIFDLTNFVAAGNIREIPRIGPGDIVFVPREENFIREFSSYLRDTLFLFSFFSLAR